MSDFKYVIRTELELTPGSLDKLLADIRILDDKIKSRTNGLSLGVRLDNRGVAQLQREIGNINASTLVKVRLDRASVAQAKRELTSLIDQARDISRVTNGATSVANAVGGQNRVGYSRQQIQDAEKLSVVKDREALSRLRNAKAMEIEAKLQKRINDELERTSRVRTGSSIELPKNHPARQVNHPDNTRIAIDHELTYLRQHARRAAEIRSEINKLHNGGFDRSHSGIESARKKASELQAELSFLEKSERKINEIVSRHQRSNDSYNQWLFNNANPSHSRTSTPPSATSMVTGQLSQQQAKREAEQKALRQSGVNSAHGDALKENRVRTRQQIADSRKLEQEAMNLQKQLLNPDIPLAQKRGMIDQLEGEYRQLAMGLGKNLSRSIRIVQRDSNGMIKEISTMTKEFTKFGEVVDRGDRSFGHLMKTMGRNIMIYSAVSMGFFEIVQALGAGVQAMAQFEAGFIRVQKVIEGRNEDIGSGKYIGGGKITSGQAKTDILNISDQYNLDSNTELMPVYDEVIRRRDLFKTREDVNRFTKTLVRSGYISQGGAEMNGEDLLRISQDSMSVYQQMFSMWTGEGKDAMAMMEQYVDYLAMLSKEGADLDKTMDAMSTLATFSGKGGADIRTISALVGSYSLSDTDASGSEIATSMKMFFSNLTNTTGSGPASARSMLGISLIDPLTKQQRSLESILSELSNNVGAGKYSDSEISSASYQLASLGAGGGRLAPQMEKILKSLPDATEWASSNGYRGLAESMTQDEVRSLIREFKGLGQELKELAINIGEAGLLNSLKLLIGAFSTLVETINYPLEKIRQLKDVLDGIDSPFGALGSEILQMTTTVLGAVMAFKLLSFGFKRFAPQSLVQGVSGYVGGIGMSRRTTNTPRGVKGGIAGNAVGSAIGEVIGAVLFGGSSKIGGNSYKRYQTTNRVANTTSNMLSKFGDALKGSLPNIIRFGSMIARLSAVGLAITGVIAAGSFMYKRSQGIKTERLNNLYTAIETPEGEEALSGKIKKYFELDKNSRSADMTGYSMYGGYRIADNNGTYLKDKAQTDELLQLTKELTSYNIVKSSAYSGNMSYSYQDKGGNMQQGQLDGSDESTSIFMNRQSSKVMQMQKLADTQNDIVKSAIDYEKIMTRISDLVGKMSDIQKNTGYISLSNQFKFAGATDSAGYLEAEIGNQSVAMNKQSEYFNTLTTDLASITNAKNLADKAVKDSRSSLAEFEGGDAFAEQIIGQFQTLQNEGKPDEILKNYSSRETEEDVAKSLFASSLYESDKQTSSLKSVREETDKAGQSYIDMAMKLKEMNTAYMVASSGLALFEGTLKGARSDVSHAQSILSLAIGDDSRLKASAQVIGAITREVEIHSTRLAVVKATMNDIKSSNSNEDFSLNSLYNPQTELTENQNAYRQLLEIYQEGTGELDSSLKSLRDQNDAIADLVLNSQKYSMYWESVQQRISMAGEIAKEMRELSFSGKITDTMSSVRGTLFGDQFDEGDYRRNRASESRDGYLGIYEKIQTSILTYGNDTAKLKEALSEIGSTTKDKIETNLITPFKNIITNEFSTSIKDFGTVVADFKKFVDEKLLDSITPKPYTMSKATPFESIIKEASLAHGVDASLIKAVIKQESGFNPNAVSSAGAQGLMQLMPGTASGLGVTNSFDPRQNIMGGTKYLKQQLNRFNGSTDSALRAYNAGPGNVLNGNAYKFDETNDYVKKVTANYNEYSNGTTYSPKPISTDKEITVEGGGKIDVGNKAQEEATKNLEAYNSIVSQATEVFKRMIDAQTDYLSATNVEFTLSKNVANSNFQARLSGMTSSATMGNFDALKEARTQVEQYLQETKGTKDGYATAISNKENEASSALSAGDKLTYEIRKAEIEVLKKNIVNLDKNTVELEKLGQNYARQAFADPTRNGKEAARLIQEGIGRLDAIRDSGDEGGIQWYKEVEDINSMFDSFMSRRKQTASQQELFDNSGYGYDRLQTSKRIGFGEDVNLLMTQMVAVSTALSQFAEGTNNWHVILEDAVILQEKLIDLENKKTEMARRYFETTGNGLGAYTNARGYTQSRDVAMSQRSLSSARGSQGSYGTATENLVNLQIISDMYGKIQSQVQEYRDGVVGAFKAGAMSLTEYIKKMNDLRNIQEETRNQALEMTSELQGSFQSSLSGALKSAMEGNQDSGSDFIGNIKSSIASSMSDQLSTIMLTQSGLMDSVNGAIATIVNSMTNGTSSANAFNITDFQGIIDGAINPILPYITAIADSTKGMFALMKDEVFNSPSGFKIDEYMYDYSKGKTYDDVSSWYPGANRDVNEAGSPNPLVGNGGSIVLPAPVTSIGNEYSKVINEIVTPIEHIGTGSLNSQIANPATTRNPISELLSGIMSMQNLYDNSNPMGLAGNSALHGGATQARELIASIANATGNMQLQELVKNLGSGTEGGNWTQDEIASYLESVDLSTFDMKIGIDGVSSKIGELNSGTLSKLDGVISAINGTASTVSTARGGATNPLPATTSVGTTVGNVGTNLGNNGVGTAAEMKANDNKARTDAEYRASELKRAQDVIDARKSQGLDTKAQEDYIKKLGTYGTANTGIVASTSSPANITTPINGYVIISPFNGAQVKVKPGSPLINSSNVVGTYHTGGIAGTMNFAGGKLRPTEMRAVLEKEETIFAKGQLGSFVDTLFGGTGGGKSGSSSDVNINIKIDSNGSVDEDRLNATVEQAVTRAVGEMYRQNRLNNLWNKGVAY